MPATPPRAALGGAPATDRRGPTTLLRAATRPRMIGLLVVLLLAAAVCGRLGAWQLDRAEIRGASAAARELAAQQARPPQDLGDVLAPQTAFTGGLVGRQVVARGTYEPDGQLLVVQRVLDDRTGYLVLTPLRVSDATPSSGGADPTGDAPVLPVVRGWVETPEDAAQLAVPTGEVTVTGYLQASEGSGVGALPAGQVDAISSAELLGRWDGPIWTAYVVLSDVEPADPAYAAGLELVPAPTRSGSGLNIQNLAYAAQWWIFGGFALFVWIRLVRDEAAGDPDDDPDDDTDGPDDPDALPGGPDAVTTDAVTSNASPDVTTPVDASASP
ncbi:SURF1 family protein [Cellulomonas sp. P22]|uniref:SURF1 family protein n=1 Tax=Cellulomonas sp. P22 TaxID=3373189 RepID=UPI00378E6435